MCIRVSSLGEAKCHPEMGNGTIFLDKNSNDKHDEFLYNLNKGEYHEAQKKIYATAKVANYSLKEENALLSVRVSAIFAATLLAGGKQECTWHHEANQQQNCEKFLFFSSKKNIYLFNICPFLKGKCHAV